MSIFISVIIPTFNRSSLILRAIDSVFKQSYANIELIVVDDGSTDDTYKLLLPLIDSGKIQYTKIQNSGVSAARNIGAAKAIGKFICFLDSDDEWLPHKLQEQIALLKERPDLKIVYGEELWVRNGKRVNQKSIHKKSGGWIFPACVHQCLIGPSSVMIEKDFFMQMGGFDEGFVVCEDYDLWLKISSLVEVGFIENPIVIKHGGHSDQLSTKFVAMDLWRLKSMMRILSIRELEHEHKLLVIDSMKRRGEILKLGFLKHGNLADYNLVRQMLSELDSL